MSIQGTCKNTKIQSEKSTFQKMLHILVIHSLCLCLFQSDLSYLHSGDVKFLAWSTLLKTSNIKEKFQKITLIKQEKVH